MKMENVMNIFNYNVFNDKLNVIIISSGLLLSTIGFLYYKGYIFNKSMGNNIDTSSDIGSEGSATITDTSTALIAITPINITSNNDNVINVDSVYSDYDTAIQELNIDVDIDEIDVVEYLDKEIQTEDLEYRNVSVNTLNELTNNVSLLNDDNLLLSTKLMDLLNSYQSKMNDLALLENSILSLNEKYKELNDSFISIIGEVNKLGSSGQKVRDLLLGQRDDMYNIAMGTIDKYNILLNKNNVSKVSTGISPIQDMIALDENEKISVGVSPIQENIDLQVNGFIAKLRDLLNDDSSWGDIDADKMAIIRTLCAEEFSKIESWVTNYNAGLVTGYDDVAVSSINTSNVVLPDVSPVPTMVSLSDNWFNSYFTYRKYWS